MRVRVTRHATWRCVMGML